MGVAPVLPVSLEAVPIQQHHLPDDGPPSGMSGQAAAGLFDNGDSVAAGRSLDVQMQVQACFLTTWRRSCAKARSLGPSTPTKMMRRGSTGRRRRILFSTDLRNAAEHTRAVLRVEASVATQATDVLGSVHAGRAITGLLDDEELFLLQIVEQSDVVGGDEQLRIARIRFPRLKPPEHVADDVHVEVGVDLIQDGRNARVEGDVQLRYQVEEALRAAGFHVERQRNNGRAVVEQYRLASPFLGRGLVLHLNTANAQVAGLQLLARPGPQSGGCA